ncbi:MAG: type I methionyl aminopeptidase [bacterium]|nr:type I methionyl aminopeptidase [bacterium]
MVFIKTEKQIKSLREGGKRLALVMKEIEKNIEPGISTLTLDEIAESLMLKLGGIPAFKNYGAELGKPYPASICASINSEVVHGIPSQEKVARVGDILKIDIGIKYDGMFTDMARTFGVGKISSSARKIIEITEKSFWEGFKKIRSGANLSDYSKTVEQYIKSRGFSAVRDLVGHGIGENLHEDPQIMNYYDSSYRDLRLKPGMVLAIEPMVNEGTHKMIIENNGWVFKTKDGKLSAHFENTILVTENGAEVLTK